MSYTGYFNKETPHASSYQHVGVPKYKIESVYFNFLNSSNKSNTKFIDIQLTVTFVYHIFQHVHIIILYCLIINLPSHVSRLFFKIYVIFYAFKRIFHNMWYSIYLFPYFSR